MKKDRNIAIVLAGGRGSRMESAIPKQYMPVCQKPILYYSLKVFEESFIDDIILVVAENDIPFCKEHIVDKFNFKKVSKIVPGGKQRYDSVYQGLKAICENTYQNTYENTYVFIHDGARPCITNGIIEKCLKTVKETEACVVAVPVKDTIKIADQDGYAVSTPDRNLLWNIQTPQVFSYGLIKQAYDNMMNINGTMNEIIGITDDAMVVEHYTNHRVKLVEGDYQNIKVTTRNDLEIVETYIKDRVW